MELKTFTTEQDWINSTIKYINNILTPYTLNLTSHISLSGGNTPKPIYQAMQKLPNIDQIRFYQVDERYVPKNHEKSNYKMIQDTLHPRHFHFFDTTLPIDECLKKYEQELPNQLDISILGLGTDGHTASLFPNTPQLSSTKKVEHTILPNTKDNEVGKERLTLTFQEIMKSKNLILIVKGKEKKQILDDLLNSNKTIQELPAKKLLEHKNLTIHFCDC